MYELIILALLRYHHFHGYLIAKIINDIVGPYAKISNGRLYPLLAKLEKEVASVFCTSDWKQLISIHRSGGGIL